MKLKKFATRAGSALSGALLPLSASAQKADINNMKDISTATSKITDTLSNSLAGILDVATIIVLLVAVPTLIWAYIRRTKGDHQGDDSLIQWMWGAIIVIIALQAIRLLAQLSN